MAADVVKTTDERERLQIIRHYRIGLFMWGLFCVQVPSQLFMFLNFIIPTLFEDYDETTIDVLRAFLIFLLTEGTINYLLVIFTDVAIPLTRNDQVHPLVPNQSEQYTTPNHGSSLRHVTNSTNQNGIAVDIEFDHYDDDSGLKWTFCEKCEMRMPPRARHCDTCQACILKRDHHCLMVGNCIGFKNQRFFVVLCFYAILCGLGCSYFTFRYLQTIYYPVCWSWTDFLPPFTVYRWIFGTVETLTFPILIIIIQFYLELVFGFFGILKFTFQMTFILKGQTSFECTKFVPVRNTNSISSRIGSVFGDFWALNFIIPLHRIFPQDSDGWKWEGIKMDHKG